MNDGKDARDYTGWALLLAGTVCGWVVHKLFSKTATIPNPVASAPAADDRPPVAEARALTQAAARSGPSFERREGQGTLLVACALSVSALAAVGFLFTYWMGGAHLLLGTTLALSVGAFGAAMVTGAHRLMSDEQVIEVREPLPSSRNERQAVSQDFFGANQAKRRRLLIAMSAGALATMAAAIGSLLRSLGKPPGPALRAAAWTRGQRLVTMEGHPISIGTLRAGDTISVFPENHLGSVAAQAVLVRVEEERLRLPEERANWAPGGYVAYSRICTHAGCSVGVYEATTYLLQCPCHQSTFDVLAGAQPTGGPTARALPQLPLYADGDGQLRAGGDFTEPPGPGFWGMP